MLCSKPIQRRRPSAAPLCGFIVPEQSTCPSSQQTMSCVSTRQMSWLSTRHISCVSTLRYAQCSQPTQRRRPSAASTKGDGRRPPPLVVSFVLAVNTGHILVLRRKTCALLKAKTSALLRRKTCAVLRARPCALFKANTKFDRLAAHLCGGGRRPPQEARGSQSEQK